MAATATNINSDNPIEIGDNDLIIVVVGEPGVGKTTFIRTLFKNNFREEEISMNGARVYRCHFKIGDTLRRVVFYEISSHPGFTSRDKLPYYEKAHIILFMYAIDDILSIQMLSVNWMIDTFPVITAKKLPVAVIGNKRDLRVNPQINESRASINLTLMTPYQVMGLFGFPVTKFLKVEVSSEDESEVLQTFVNIIGYWQAPI